MNHPTQLNIFTQGQSPRELKIELPKPRIADFKHWREGDLLDMVELTCELVKSDEYRDNPQQLLSIADELQLPCSLTTLLLNSIGRIENLFQLTMNEERFSLEVREIPNTAQLARHLGLGGVFTREVEAIWEGQKPKPQSVQELKNEAAKPVSVPVVQQPQEYAPIECRITTNQTATGRQWKIGGQLIAEVELTQLGHIGKMYSGQFCNPTRPYRDYEPAATQCRQHTEGILKFLKTIPR